MNKYIIKYRETKGSPFIEIPIHARDITDSIFKFYDTVGYYDIIQITKEEK